MSVNNIVTIIFSILSSSVVTLILSTYFFQPAQDRKKYVFDEKKELYNSIVIYAEILLYPVEAQYSLNTKFYSILSLSESERKKRAINELKVIIPRVMLITKNKNVIKKIKQFIELQTEEQFDALLEHLRKDLYK